MAKKKCRALAKPEGPQQSATWRAFAARGSYMSSSGVGPLASGLKVARKLRKHPWATKVCKFLQVVGGGKRQT